MIVHQLQSSITFSIKVKPTFYQKQMTKILHIVVAFPFEIHQEDTTPVEGIVTIIIIETDQENLIRNLQKPVNTDKLGFKMNQPLG